VLIGETLIVTSDLLLGLPALGVAVHALAVLVLGLGLSGLSVGLGAVMPNFRETDPSKIAVGFGGTLSLIVCLLYLVVVVLTMAGPFHVLNAIRPDDLWTWAGWAWVGGGVAAGLAAGAAAVALPLRAGTRALRRMEF
jgi:ABC-2 type transport system permease protein